MAFATTIEGRIQSARLAMEQHEFDRALLLLNAVLVLDPANAGALALATEIGEREERARITSIEGSATETSSDTRDATFDFHLTRAHRLFLEGRHDLALAEVTLALMEKPADEQAGHLEREIQQTLNRANAYAEDTSTPHAVYAVLLTARRYIEREKLAEALEEVESGLAMDPRHDELCRMRETILERMESNRKRERERILHERIHTIRERFARTEFEQAAREVDEALEEFPGSQELLLLKSDIEESGNKWQELQLFERHTAGVQERIRTARQMLQCNRLDDATAEIALGLILAPYNEDLRKLEKELWETETRLEEKKQREEEERRKVQETVKLKMHLLAAEEFAKHSQFNRALDEIVHAYLIDPTDAETRQLERRIRLLRERAGTPPLKLVYKNGRAAGGR